VSPPRLPRLRRPKPASGVACDLLVFE